MIFVPHWYLKVKKLH